MTDTLTIAVLLQLVGLLLLVAELFLPSHGAITVLALGCLAGGIYYGFQYSWPFGVVSVVGSIVLLPIFAAVAVRLWPKTFVGRRVAPPNRPFTPSESPAYSASLAALVGQTGTTLTPLHPVGTCEFAGRRVECLAESGMIDRNTQVVVVAVQGQTLIVRVA